jgi:hypothetical protein
MILKGKVYEVFPFFAEIYLTSGDKLTLPIKGLIANQHVEIEIRPVLANGAAAGSQIPLPFPPAI